MLKTAILLSLFLTSFVSYAADVYNREECDSVIDVKKFVVAGSLNNPSAGGKTYNFDRIVGALENELLSGQPPQVKNFECLSLLHKKAHEDATEYWVGRLARSTCAGDNGEVPSIKPPGCDDDLWEKFHASKTLIDRSASRIKKLTTECVEKNGVKSCESIKTLTNIQEFTEELGANNSDKCCNTDDGAAYKVLRGFYTVEFGDMNDTELQKECYKRTRPGNQVKGFSSGVGGCIKNVALGIAEAVMKWFKTAKALWEVGTNTETWRMIRNLEVSKLKDAVLSLLEAMMEQMGNQFTASTSCFTGQYKLDQACKLASSIAVDFIVGGGVAKGAGFLAQLMKAGVKDMAAIAKGMVTSNPKIAQMASKLKKTTGKGTTTATSTATRAAAKRSASHLAAALKPVADFSKSVAARVRKLREKEGITRQSLTNRIEPGWGPNASVTVAATETATSAGATAAIQTSSRATSVASSGAGMTAKSMGKIEKSIRAFRSSEYKAMYATRGTRAVDAPESLFVKPSRLKGKSPSQQMQIIEDAAKVRRARAAKLPSDQAREILDNIDDALIRIRARLGVPEKKVASTSAGAAARTAATGVAPADLTAATTKAIDTTIPTAPASTAGSTGSTAVVGTATASTTTSGFTNTAESFINSIPKVDIKAITNSTTKINKTLQQQIDSVQTFEARARANAAAANPAATARSSVWANQSNRAISKDALRRHGEIENLYKKGLINAEQAHAMHDIVRVTENSATGTATRFNTRYISTPNTNPSTFVLKERGAPLTAAGAVGLVLERSIYSDIGSVTTNKQIEQTSDAAKGQRYDLDTIKASAIVVQKLTETPNSIRNEFSKLKTEAEILDRADELRVKVKTVENSAGTEFEAEAKEALGELITQINTERDRALARIKPKDSAAPVPASDDPAVKYGIPIDPEAD
ncbi:MAG: hypothetical protein B7Y39_00525 [Bdellovibrio sp. 28-41-41]|nr:MAG: hypothetical protein B7Y39_00525 [Bdellovibrio sp. 28-41-41]